MHRRALLSLAAILSLTGCTALLPGHGEISAEEFTRRAREIPGVTGVTVGGDDWAVAFEPSLAVDALAELSRRMFELVNEVRLPGSARVHLSAGAFTAPVLRRGGGRPSAAPEMRWVRWLDGAPAHGAVTIDESRATVPVDGDPLEWTQALVARHPKVMDGAVVRVVSKGSEVNLAAGSARDVADLQSLSKALSGSGATFVDAFLDGVPSVELGVADRAQAKDVVRRLTAAFPDTERLELKLTTADGPGWRGRLRNVAQLVDASSGLAAAVAATGANLRSVDRDAVIEVPGADVLDKVVALLASPAWTGDPNATVSIRLKDNPNDSVMPAKDWAVAGPILSAALRAGLPLTRITSGSGPKPTQFRFSFMQQQSGPDLTTAEGYRPIIDVLRAHPWEGETQVGLDYDDILLFRSTAKGRARDAYFARHGARTRKPHGWASDFLKAWDATATE